MGILNEEIMATGLTAVSKKEAIETLSKLLFEHGYISDIDYFQKDIYYRESLGKTGIGNFIAIPHGQSDKVNKNGIAIGKFNNEIPWESLDEHGVKIVCLFCVKAGDGGENEHLKMLAVLAGKLGNEAVVEKLLKAKNVKEMKEALD